MLITLWIINILLALAFLGAGAMKLSKDKAALAEAGMGWAETYPAAGVKLIGLAEVLGALGLILPLAFDVAAILTPVAAVCLVVVMIGAVITHLSRKESPAGASVLGVVSVLSAVFGFIVVL